MSEILLYYKRPDPTTWVYLSSFLTIGLFFVFHRFWSIRNLDILLLILLAPGLLMVHEGYRRQLIESETVARQKTQPPAAQPPAAADPNARHPEAFHPEALRESQLSAVRPVDSTAERRDLADGSGPTLCDRTGRCRQRSENSESKNSEPQEIVSNEGEPETSEPDC